MIVMIFFVQTLNTAYAASWVSTDTGIPVLGTVPPRLLVTSSNHYYLFYIDDLKVFTIEKSDDSGNNWTIVYSDDLSAATGNVGYIHAAINSSDTMIASVSLGSGKGDENILSRIVTSSDGTIWDSISLNACSLCNDSSIYVDINDSGQMFRSMISPIDSTTFDIEQASNLRDTWELYISGGTPVNDIFAFKSNTDASIFYGLQGQTFFQKLGTDPATNSTLTETFDAYVMQPLLVDNLSVPNIIYPALGELRLAKLDDLGTWGYSTILEENQAGALSTNYKSINISDDNNGNYLITLPDYSTAAGELYLAVSANHGDTFTVTSITNDTTAKLVSNAISDVNNDYMVAFLKGADSEESITIAQYDQTGPSLSIDSFDTTTTDTTPTFTGSASDSISNIQTIEIQVDGTSGAWTTCTADDGTYDGANEVFTCQIASAMSSGDHTVYIRAQDDASNYKTADVLNITIEAATPAEDAEPSNVSVKLKSTKSSDKKSKYTRTKNIVVNITASNVTDMMVSEDSNFSGVNWETYATTKNFTLSEGNGKKKVFVKLKNGTNESIVYDASITLDTKKPTDNIEIGINKYELFKLGNDLFFDLNKLSSDRYLRVYLNTEDKLTGVTKIRFSTSKSKLDDQEWKEYKSYIDVKVPTEVNDGFKLYFQLKDAAGNSSNKFEQEFNVSNSVN